MSRVRRALAGPLLAALAVLPLPAAAEEGSPPTVPLAPRGADEAARRRALADLAAAERAAKAAQAAESRAAAELRSAKQDLQQAEARVLLNGAEEQSAARQLAEARGRLREVAVAQYLNGGVARSVDHLLKARDHLDMARRNSLMSTATDVQRTAVDTYEAARAEASARVEADIRAVEQSLATQARALSELSAADGARKAAAQEVEHRRLLLDLVSAAAPVPPSDIPRLFLDAYRRASTAMERRAPGCRVSWTAVAAIGKIESNHGRYRGAQLALNGNVVPAIIGIPLDGTNNTRVIADTDRGELDGDTEFDRAVGPMQFIPSTWRFMRQDGNGDGVSDPNNAYDAAMGTAAYLCRATRGAPVDVEEGQRTAFFSYNRSEAYVELALWWMRTYDALADRLPPPPAPPAPAKRPRR